jgi:DNA-binding MarR family transcriptional regulator
MEPPMSAAFDRNQSAGYLINHLARIFANALAEEIRPLGLAPGQFMVLLELWREEGQTQRALTGRLDVEQATMANTLARMERDGLVVRRPHPEDGRAQSIHLTTRARALEGPATAAATAVNERMLRRLPAPSRAAFLEAMRAVIAEARRDADG